MFLKTFLKWYAKESGGWGKNICCVSWLINLHRTTDHNITLVESNRSRSPLKLYVNLLAPLIRTQYMWPVRFRNFQALRTSRELQMWFCSWCARQLVEKSLSTCSHTIQLVNVHVGARMFQSWTAYYPKKTIRIGDIRSTIFRIFFIYFFFALSLFWIFFLFFFIFHRFPLAVLTFSQYCIPLTRSSFASIFNRKKKKIPNR
jgi:hypothetical protein